MSRDRRDQRGGHRSGRKARNGCDCCAHLLDRGRLLRTRSKGGRRAARADHIREHTDTETRR